MKTLIHICCAPCANQPIDVLRTDGFEVTGYWYNPNIHPFTEYRARRNCVRDYAEKIELPLIERDDYGLRPFVREVAERAAHEYGVQFLYRDFRPYFRPGQEKARELEMYIQKYCGCVFSEQERYLKPKKIIP